MSDYRVYTFCPEHGINCKIDGDGACSACGASAVGPALDEIERLRAQLVAKDAVVEAARKIGKDEIAWQNLQKALRALDAAKGGGDDDGQ